MKVEKAAVLPETGTPRPAGDAARSIIAFA